MKKIICPTDFSETADRAIAYAASLCKKMEAELTLLHVQPVFSFTSDDMITGRYITTEASHKRLRDMSQQIREMFQIPCSPLVESVNNDLSDIISKRAIDFDLIVMGTDGANDYYEFFFGSPAYRVAKESLIPVLLIPAGCGYQDISTIAFAFDYEHEQELPLKQLAKFASLLSARITVLQVKSHYKREQELNSEDVEIRTKMLYNLLDLEFDTLFSDEVSESINEYITKSRVEVLALCSIHYNFIKTIFHTSVIKTLSATASCPIFIFHE